MKIGERQLGPVRNGSDGQRLERGQDLGRAGETVRDLGLVDRPAGRGRKTRWEKTCRTIGQ